MNDPVKPIVTMYLPEKVFKSLTFREPVRLITKDFNAQFYIERITGYEGPHLPCTAELIKLP